MTKKIVEFANEETIEGFFLIKNLQVRADKNGKKYLDIDLTDQTSEINAKYWEASEEDFENFFSGQLVKVRGKVNSWQDKLQLRINKIRNVEDTDEYKIEDYVPKAPGLSSDFYAEIMEYIENMKDEDIKNICRDIYEDNKEKLEYYPAAQKNHHSVYGGLLYHISTMLNVAESLSKIYTFINTDLLYAGVMLHDISKIEEMSANELGVVSEYTFEGQLLGHIIQGIKVVNEKGKKFSVPEEKVILLEHMILSHHNEPEYGSPKRPMIPEAELLCHIDMIDARMFDMNKVLENVDSGTFSDKVWLLNNRKLYKY